MHAIVPPSAGDLTHRATRGRRPGRTGIGERALLLGPLGHREEDAGEKRMTGCGLVSSL